MVIPRTLRASLACLALLAPACGGEPESPRRVHASDVEACSARLIEIYRALIDAEKGGWKPEAGASMLDAPFSSGVWGEERRGDVACPGAKARYAERDLVAFPLERFPTRGTEILLACPNGTGASHAGALNALFADGSVKTYLLAQEIEEGSLSADATVIPIGGESPIVDLRRVR